MVITNIQANRLQYMISIYLVMKSSLFSTLHCMLQLTQEYTCISVYWTEFLDSKGNFLRRHFRTELTSTQSIS